MDEDHPVPAGAGPGRLVHEAEAGIAKSRERLVEIGHPERHVMEPGAPSVQEASDGRVGIPGLEKLDGADEGHVDALVGEGLHRGTRLPGQEFVQRPRLRDGADGDGHVIERKRIHTGIVRSGSGWSGVRGAAHGSDGVARRQGEGRDE